MDFKKNSKIVVKSGFMVGVGETKKEIQTLIDDLNQAGCDLVTVGQYLQPTKEHIKVKKFYTLAEFKNIKNYASNKPHIKSVECGPMVRSSYHAESQLMNIENNIECGEK